MLRYTISACQAVLVAAMLLLATPVPSPLDGSQRTQAAAVIASHGTSWVEEAQGHVHRIDDRLSEALRGPALAMRYALGTVVADASSTVAALVNTLPGTALPRERG